jgi:hypothetical protein
MIIPAAGMYYHSHYDREKRRFGIITDPHFVC